MCKCNQSASCVSLCVFFDRLRHQYNATWLTSQPFAPASSQGVLLIGRARFAWRRGPAAAHIIIIYQPPRSLFSRLDYPADRRLETRPFFNLKRHFFIALNDPSLSFNLKWVQ